ncbi:hypothetical protein AVEN_165438-1 [Araneus ventricosus]|uniref:Uncharacterized protein n=1 Tax=Araneus ventricosus TaxID=182803 RepID=A0A4Y2AVQ1_ARAVE|nr:hypothetical protein AVEN_165438-1 [Araneus ventricosus]
MAESKELTHASITLSDLSLDSSIFLESLKGSTRQTVPSDDEIVFLDDTQRSAVAGESGDECAGEDKKEGVDGANGDKKIEEGKAPEESNGPDKGSERPKESDVTDPGLSALLERATALLAELGLDDYKGGQVLGLIFEAFGLRSGSMSHKARIVSKPDTQTSNKTTRGKRTKTAVAPPKVPKVTKPAPKRKADAPKEKPVEQAAEQPTSAPQSFAAAARKGASVAQNPPVRGSAQSTKKAPPGRTPRLRPESSSL